MKKLYYFHVAVHGDGELQSLLSKSTSQSKQQRVRERERGYQIQRHWENSGSRGRIHQAIATHDTNSNAALLYLLRNLKKKLTRVGYIGIFAFFNRFGIRKPPVLVVVISFSCYVLMLCPHASNAQKRLAQKVLTRDGDLRLPHENLRYILQIPWTKRIHNSKKNDIRTVKLNVIKHNNIQYYKINNK